MRITTLRIGSRWRGTKLVQENQSGTPEQALLCMKILGPVQVSRRLLNFVPRSSLKVVQWLTRLIVASRVFTGFTPYQHSPDCYHSA